MREELFFKYATPVLILIAVALLCYVTTLERPKEDRRPSAASQIPLDLMAAKIDEQQRQIDELRKKVSRHYKKVEEITSYREDLLQIVRRQESSIGATMAEVKKQNSLIDEFIKSAEKNE